MQNGLIYRVGNCWLLRYWTTVLENGKPVKRRVAKKLATYSREYRTEASVRHLAAKILAPINAKTARPESTDTLAAFLQTYIANREAEGRLRPSSVKTAHDCFKLLEPHLGNLRLAAARVADIDTLLRRVAETPRAHTVYKSVKSFLSGAFKYALRRGILDANPVRDAELPQGRKPKETHAYTLDEVGAMLHNLSEPARTIVLVAAFTGLRSSELKGLRWEDYTGDELRVSRGVWNGKVNETKTQSSRASVPMLPIVAQALAEHRARAAGDGYIFCGATGEPIRLEHLVARSIRAELERAGLTWHGWHAFRRGLATNLYSLGAPDKTVQTILRHSNVAVTMQYYVKPVAAESHAAMRKLETAFQRVRRSA